MGAPSGADRRDAGSDVADWLLRQALDRPDVETLAAGLCERLVAAGLPLWRLTLGSRVLHPNFHSFTIRWLRGDGVVREDHVYGTQAQPAYQRSPLRYVLERRQTRLRRHLVGPDAALDFPVLQEFRDQGATDYFLTITQFQPAPRQEEANGVLATWATDHTGGFTDADIALIERIQVPLAVVMQRIVADMIAESVATTYLGAHAGRQVMAGKILRGSAESIRAVLCIADLRGFTALAERTDAAVVVRMLDGYFDRIVGPIEAHGGEVLKFLGDGLLAIFGLQDRLQATVCRDAVLALGQAFDAVDAWNAERRAAGEPALELDAVLHIGEVMYGNVGASRRLDFTVIGPAVNEASRMEALCGALDTHLLVSKAFAESGCDCRPYALVSLGHHPLRGVQTPQELLTLRRA
jgi:adenylate cyclase